MPFLSDKVKHRMFLRQAPDAAWHGSNVHALVTFGCRLVVVLFNDKLLEDRRWRRYRTVITYIGRIAHCYGNEFFFHHNVKLKESRLVRTRVKRPSYKLYRAIFQQPFDDANGGNLAVNLKGEKKIKCRCLCTDKDAFGWTFVLNPTCFKRRPGDPAVVSSSVHDRA